MASDGVDMFNQVGLFFQEDGLLDQRGNHVVFRLLIKPSNLIRGCQLHPTLQILEVLEEIYNHSPTVSSKNGTLEEHWSLLALFR